MSEAPNGADGAQRVSSLELFFDLVFVFTITQLTGVLVHEPNWRGLLQVSPDVGLIFWMYGSYAQEGPRPRAFSLTTNGFAAVRPRRARASYAR